MTDTGLLTVKEAARCKGCTVTYIYALLAADRLPRARKVGKVWQIPRQAILTRTKGSNGLGRAA